MGESTPYFNKEKEMKQQQHIRKYRSGKKTVVNPGNKRKSVFGSKLVPQRYLITRDLNTPQPAWRVHDPKDKDLTYFQLVEYHGYPNSPYGDADKDGINNIFDKKPLNVAVRKITPPALKKGNTKLTKVIGIFSLPRYYTCPGRTELCERYCYAEPPERFRPGVVYSRNKNLAWTLRPDFVDVTAAIIKNMKLPWFRIHESGDFYNQKYFEKWLEIARRNPKTRFLAYTKNWNLNFKGIPSNLTIRYSSDISSKKIVNSLPACYVGVRHPENFFLCKKKCEPGFCMACWDKRIDVYIPVHSVGKAEVDKMFFKQFNSSIPAELIGRDTSKGYHPSRLIVGGSKI
jgi:hypothetical protein